jgi:phosphatidate cytidylyltransferase
VHLFLFDKIQSLTKNIKVLILLGYIVLPFIFITKYHLVSRLQSKIIIGLFIIIWTTYFCLHRWKSIGKNKLFERISLKKTIEGFGR